MTSTQKIIKYIATISFATLSVIFYVIAIIGFVKGNKSVAISCLCL